MIRGNLLYIVLLLFVLNSSCVNKNNQPDQQQVNPRTYDENLKEANRLMARSEDDEIDDYIFRMGWKMTKSPTGLRYWIYKQGEGKKAEKLSIVRFNFKVELVNGFVCYDSEHDGYQEIQLGRSTAPGGLEEALSMMREGDRARLILPSHLAFGLLGDQDKIPSRAILIYDVEIIQVRN